MNFQVKRSVYTPEFKIKVLEHYLKNGGESVFGLKTKTAEHFKIGKKTVHRLVNVYMNIVMSITFKYITL